jgi:hypothetical protein
MTDEPKLSWQHAWDYGIETGRYILVGEPGGDWRDAFLQIGPNFDTAPLHTDPRIAAEQQILDNMVRAQEQRRTSNDPDRDQAEEV